MINQLSKKWALYVSKDRYAMHSALACFALAIVFAAVGMLWLGSDALAGLGLVLFLIGFNLFERAGLLRLMRDRLGEHSGAE